MSQFDKIVLFLLVAFSFSQSSLVFAGPLFLYSNANAFGVTGSVIQQSLTGGPVTASYSTGSPPNIESAQAAAAAAPGLLQAFASANDLSGTPNSGAGAGAIAQFDGLDIMLTGPGSTPLSVSFNFVISGLATGNIYMPGGGGFGVIQLLVTATIGGPGPSTDVGSGQASYGFSGSHAVLASSTGSLAGYTGGTRAITSSPFVVTPGTPFELAMELHPYMFEVQQATMTLDLMHTVGFATDQPVFNVPAGYSVNSLDGKTIVNNRFGIGGPTVPEPSSVLLLGTAVALLVATRGITMGRTRRTVG